MILNQFRIPTILVNIVSQLSSCFSQNQISLLFLRYELRPFWFLLWHRFESFCCIEEVLVHGVLFIHLCLFELLVSCK